MSMNYLEQDWQKARELADRLEEALDKPSEPGAQEHGRNLIRHIRRITPNRPGARTAS